MCRSQREVVEQVYQKEHVQAESDRGNECEIAAETDPQYEEVDEQIREQVHLHQRDYEFTQCVAYGKIN